MSWRALPRLTPRQARDVDSLRRKARFLVDENLPDYLAATLRDLGWNTKTAEELRLHGKSDEFVFAAAWKERRILLTKDKDYFDSRRFPEHRNPGVVILPDGPIDTDLFITALTAVHRIVGPYARHFEQTWVDLSAKDTIQLKARNNATGSIETTRYRRRQDGTLEEWVEP